jgi:hypothetical protein
MTAWVLAALHGLGRFAVTAQPSRLVSAALCTGLLAGTKGTGPVWAVGLGIAVLLLAVWHVRAGRLTSRRAGTAVGGTVVAGLLLAGWWYARSALETGNPLYPFEVRLAGTTVFDGPLRVADVLTPRTAVQRAVAGRRPGLLGQ